MTGSRNLLWMIPLALLLGWPVYGPPLARFLAPRGDFGKAGEVGVATKRFVMEDVFYIQEKGGKTDWHIRTNRLATDRANSDLMEMAAVKGTFFRNNAENMQVTASSGLYDSKNEVLTLRNNVDLLTADGYTIRSEQLAYHEQDKLITTRSPIRMTGKKLDIRGNG
ncbi:MAG TPA: LPS export ABC transporter periplasmic protein LptC, partial [Desulfurivibrionaceae bacterium]|nr:LPS export ABC transporter periplasmic protein LptC [Desulfurivibrionaceae bacterium]